MTSHPRFASLLACLPALLLPMPALAAGANLHARAIHGAAIPVYGNA